MNNTYEAYKVARDAAWKVLLKCKINSLPINLAEIADHYGIKVVSYSKTNLLQVFAKEVLSGDGFIADLNGEKRIFINDKIHYRNRRRFTMGHELGHGILNHDISAIHYRNSEIDSQSDIQEYQANIFSRDILMPATVLAALNIRTPDEIMHLCKISRQSATIRANRLLELYKRNMFNKHPLEKRVRELFDGYISETLYARKN